MFTYKSSNIMIKADYYYKRNLEKIMNEGCLDENPRPKYKDGTPAHSKFITQVWEEYDISKGEFPITTLRTTAIKTGIKEILWIYQDQSVLLSDAHARGITWWDDWNIGDGTIGERYGATVKKYDLINKLIKNLKNDPFSRRHIMSFWQEESLTISKGLYPCAYETLWSVRKVNGEMFLDMTLIQRSNDYIMAGYINKVQYVALMMMIATAVGYKVGKFGHLVQNLHVYDRHFEAVKEILETIPDDTQPSISFNNKSTDFYTYKIEDFISHDIQYIPKLQSPLEIAI